jgi:hypothetical protein
MNAQTNPLIALRAAAALQKSGVTPGDRYGSALSTVAEGAEKAQANRMAAEDALMKAKIAGAAAKQARKDGFTDKAMALEDIERKNVVEGARFNAEAAGKGAQVLGHIDTAKISAGPHWAAANKPNFELAAVQAKIKSEIAKDPSIVKDPQRMAQVEADAYSATAKETRSGYSAGVRADTGSLKEATDSVGTRLMTKGPERDEYRRRQETDKANGTNTAEEYRKSLILNEVNILSGAREQGGGASAPAAPAAPAAASSPISVKAPNGQVYSFPDQKSANAFKAAAGIK